MKIAVIHGPNLNLLGTREPHIYGRETLAQIDERLRERCDAQEARLTSAQYNSEGDIIEAVHALRGKVDGILINAGAFSHTSLAIRDALAAVGIPFVEVHMTNIYAREPERRRSALADAAVGIVCGFGALSYELALTGLIARLHGR